MNQPKWQLAKIKNDRERPDFIGKQVWINNITGLKQTLGRDLDGNSIGIINCYDVNIYDHEGVQCVAEQVCVELQSEFSDSQKMVSIDEWLQENGLGNGKAIKV